jgi:signal transduction histidine kinase
MSLAACGGILILALLVLLRREKSPLSLPLGLWALDLFAWNFATLAYSVTGQEIWHLIDCSFSPFTPPLALHIILVFVGKARKLRWLLVLSYIAFGLLSLSTATTLLHPDSPCWGYGFLGGWIPLVVLSMVLLVRYLRQTKDLSEQMRTRLIIAAQLVGGVLGSTELWNDFITLPALGHLGALGSAVLMTLVVLRLRLVGELRSVVVVYAFALAALAVFVYVVVSRWLGGNTALLILGIFSVTAALLAAAWDLIASLVRWLTQIKNDADLGRMADQLAHDLKNPLTPLKLGLQYMLRELAEGRPIREPELEKLLHKVRRIEQVLKKYPLLPEVPPVLVPVGVNRSVESALETLASKLEAGEVEVQRELADDLPEVQADEDLIAGVLENVINNARQAMPDGGRLLIRTAATSPGAGDQGQVMIEIEDTGHGMDTRQQTLAFERHFTTKREGSGLGLWWARKVIEERHHGSIELSSVPGKGTTVRLCLPQSGNSGE